MIASVIVATRDRHADLVRCLEALRGQSVASADFEIIVVDDGSRTPVTIAEAPGPRLRLIRLDQSRGPAGARNAAIEVATAPILATTDDDCRPAPDWLARGIAAIERGDDLVAGRTVPDPERAIGRGPFSYTMDVPGPDPRYSTCNMFYRRDVVARVGGFSDRFYSVSGYHLGEDADLAWRAIETGARAGYAGDAVVIHAVRDQTFAEYLRSRRRLDGIVPLVKRHPGVKAAYYGERFYSPTHALVVAGLVGTVAAPLLGPLSLALWAPYLVWRSREKRALVTAPSRFLRRNRHLFHWLVIDVTEVLIFARASVRYRHFYL